jgi:hypothetical protein
MSKRALLIGINDYKGFNDLRGCINDIKSMRKILMNYLGFEAENIRVVVDARATKKNILDRINWLVKTAESGDYLLMHFAGHGAQIRDRDGDELADQLDEIICPYDMDWDGTFITDDELYSIFKELKKDALLEVFLDCCHSGTGTREVSAVARNVDEEETRYRYLEPPFDIVSRSDIYPELPARGFGSKSSLAKQNHVLWSACKDNQQAADAYIGGRFQGAFTYSICNHFEATGGMVSRIGLLRRIRASIRHGGFSQIPQLVAPEDLGLRESYAKRDCE